MGLGFFETFGRSLRAASWNFQATGLTGLELVRATGSRARGRFDHVTLEFLDGEGEVVLTESRHRHVGLWGSGQRRRTGNL